MPDRSARILLVDDEQSIQTLLSYPLRKEGYQVVQVTDGRTALNRFEEQAFDLVVLDLMLPKVDGLEICRSLRSRSSVPIIILTGSDEESDVVRGLDSGANDYIAKPFRLAELLARVRAQLRIFENSEDAVFTIGPYTFRPSAKLLQEPAKNRRIRLTEKEAAILKFLYRAGTRPVARQVLLNEVWGYNAAVTTHTLETHIYRLRQKIEPDPSNARLLVTEGGGYRLDPDGHPPATA